MHNVWKFLSLKANDRRGGWGRFIEQRLSSFLWERLRIVSEMKIRLQWRYYSIYEDKALCFTIEESIVIKLHVLKNYGHLTSIISNYDKFEYSGDFKSRPRCTSRCKVSALRCTLVGLFVWSNSCAWVNVLFMNTNNVSENIKTSSDAALMRISQRSSSKNKELPKLNLSRSSSFYANFLQKHLFSHQADRAQASDQRKGAGKLEMDEFVKVGLQLRGRLMNIFVSFAFGPFTQQFHSPLVKKKKNKRQRITSSKWRSSRYKMHINFSSLFSVVSITSDETDGFNYGAEDHLMLYA